MSEFFFFSSRRRHTRYIGDWSSDVCSSDLLLRTREAAQACAPRTRAVAALEFRGLQKRSERGCESNHIRRDRKSTRLNSSHRCISYAVFCLKKKKNH